MRHTGKGGSDVHLTPPEILDRLHVVSRDWYDPCPHPRGDVDGLDCGWPEEIPAYVNPPFSNLGGWTSAVISHADRGGDVVLLVPARTSQTYWTKAMRAAAAVHFWTGNTDRGGKIGRRVRFLSPDGKRQAGAPFDVALFTFSRSERFVWSVTCAIGDVTQTVPLRSPGAPVSQLVRSGLPTCTAIPTAWRRDKW